MKMITNYQLNGFTNNGNTTLAVREDSTLNLRRDASFTRRPSTFNSGTGVFSVPTNGVAIRRDVANQDGGPSGQRASVSIDFRLPVASSEDDLDALILDAKSYINSSELKEALIQQTIPTENNDVE